MKNFNTPQYLDKLANRQEKQLLLENIIFGPLKFIGKLSVIITAIAASFKLLEGILKGLAPNLKPLISLLGDVGKTYGWFINELGKGLEGFGVLIGSTIKRVFDPNAWKDAGDTFAKIFENNLFGYDLSSYRKKVTIPTRKWDQQRDLGFDALLGPLSQKDVGFGIVKDISKAFEVFAKNSIEAVKSLDKANKEASKVDNLKLALPAKSMRFASLEQKAIDEKNMMEKRAKIVKSYFDNLESLVSQRVATGGYSVDVEQIRKEIMSEGKISESKDIQKEIIKRLTEKVKTSLDTSGIINTFDNLYKQLGDAFAKLGSLSEEQKGILNDITDNYKKETDMKKEFARQQKYAEEDFKTSVARSSLFGFAPNADPNSKISSAQSIWSKFSNTIEKSGITGHTTSASDFRQFAQDYAVDAQKKQVEQSQRIVELLQDFQKDRVRAREDEDKQLKELKESRRLLEVMFGSGSSGYLN